MRGFHLHKPHASQLSELARAELEQHAADIWVPIRKRGTLFGAIALSGGMLDRDVVVTAGAVAEHLGIKFENYGLFRRMLGAAANVPRAASFDIALVELKRLNSCSRTRRRPRARGV